MSKMFDIDKELKKLEKFDLDDLVVEITRLVTLVENYNVSKEEQSLRNEYLFMLKRLGFILHSGHKPSGISSSSLLKYEPIVLKLVQNKQFDESILEIFRQSNT